MLFKIYLRYSILLLITSWAINQSSAQEVLQLEDAITIALENNYGIQVAQKNQVATEMQVYKSNAGFGPTVDWTTNFNVTGNNVNQQFIDDRTVNRFGRTLSPNTSVTAGITLFDGGRMQATYDRLGQLSEFSKLQGNIVIQNTVMEVMTVYYNINREKERISFLVNIIKNYEERLKITEERWNVGRGSKIDFLQSKTDLNTQLSQFAVVQNNLINAKVILNGVLNREPNLEFETVEIPKSEEEYLLDALINKAKDQNREILLLQKSIEISELTEKQIAADRAPQVSAQSAFGISYTNSNTGFLKSNRSFALNAGVTARWNLYDGHNRKNQIAISKINTEIIELQQDQLETQIINELSFAYNQYNSDKELLTFEIMNKDIAEENLTISLEKFRLGGSTILELNEAQRTYDTALNRLVNAQFNIRISELELLRLSGSIVE
ncbi:MAG: outer membrane protein [Saprospiraceae bacterium]|jgi:outer membrane protein